MEKITGLKKILLEGVCTGAILIGSVGCAQYNESRDKKQLTPTPIETTKKETEVRTNQIIYHRPISQSEIGNNNEKTYVRMVDVKYGNHQGSYIEYGICDKNGKEKPCSVIYSKKTQEKFIFASEDYNEHTKKIIDSITGKSLLDEVEKNNQNKK